MNEIHQLIYEELTSGCRQQGCRNRFCICCVDCETISGDLHEASIQIEAEYGPMALCLPSLRKLSGIFASLRDGSDFVHAWIAPPTDEVVIIEHTDFELLGMAIACNLSTLDGLDFMLPDTAFTKSFFQQLLLTERNSYSNACAAGKIVKMENCLTKFIQKLINAIFSCEYQVVQKANITVAPDLLLKLIELPDCLLERNSTPIAFIAGLISQLAPESRKGFIDQLKEMLFSKGLMPGSNPIISACNQYISVKLANNDRSNHMISVTDFLPQAEEVISVLKLMKVYYDIFKEFVYSERLNDEDYIPLKKLLHNDFINSNAYNITPDTDFWLAKNKTEERTDVSILPIELQFIMRHRENQQFPLDMFSILDYPFLLNGGTKAQIFKYDVTMNIPHISELKVRREFIVEDTLHYLEARETDWLAFQARAILRLPLKVVFDGEEGVDAGGLSNEFFSLIIEQLFHEKYSLFTFVEEANVYYFNKFPCLEENELRKYYGFVGIVLGLALINSVNIDVAFPACFFRLLLNIPLEIRDLADLDATLFQTLRIIESYDADDFADVFCLDFSVGEIVFGETVRQALKGTGTEPVTLANKNQYVNLRWRYEIINSVQPQLLALEEGFMEICDSASLDLLDAHDLSLMLCGETTLDFLALRKVTKYEEPYTAGSAIVEWFWHIVLEYDEQQKSDFCQFVFGSRRAPAGGLGKARFEIHKNGEDDFRLPTSHTCFGILMLPQYSCEDILRQKLAIAIVNNEGFGLQ